MLSEHMGHWYQALERGPNSKWVVRFYVPNLPEFERAYFNDAEDHYLAWVLGMYHLADDLVKYGETDFLPEIRWVITNQKTRAVVRTIDPADLQKFMVNEMFELAHVFLKAKGSEVPR